MMKQLIAMLSVALTLTAAVARADDPDPDVFELNIRFTIATASYSNAMAAQIDEWIDRHVVRAEELFVDAPRLKINWTAVREEILPDQEPGELRFDNKSAYRKYMDEHFDVDARTRTDGTFQVVIVDRICVGDGKDANGDVIYKCEDGRASLPRWVTPFLPGRKHGIAVTYRNRTRDPSADDSTSGEQNGAYDWVFAHELGHMFSLIHTFDEYRHVKSSMNCNREYRGRSSGGVTGICNSCAGTRYDDGTNVFCSGAANLMDYCVVEVNTYLNACQIARAAGQRRNYMTGDGWTDYYKIKGTRGAQSCSKDRDCDSRTEYCDKGTLTVGKNVCAPKRAIGEKCTRKKQCQSGRCSVGKCRR